MKAENGVRGAEKPSQQVDLADFGRRSTMALLRRKGGGDGGRVRGRELHPDAEVAQRGAIQGCHNMSDSMFALSGIKLMCHLNSNLESRLANKLQVRRRAEKGPGPGGDEGPAVQVGRGKL